jgi:hypothetical protein
MAFEMLNVPEKPAITVEQAKFLLELMNAQGVAYPLKAVRIAVETLTVLEQIAATGAADTPK